MDSKTQMKICNIDIKFSGREGNMKDERVIPDPVMKEVGNEKKGAGNQQATKTPSPKARNKQFQNPNPQISKTPSPKGKYSPVNIRKLFTNGS